MPPRRRAWRVWQARESLAVAGSELRGLEGRSADMEAKGVGPSCPAKPAVHEQAAAAEAGVEVCGDLRTTVALNSAFHRQQLAMIDEHHAACLLRKGHEGGPPPAQPRHSAHHEPPSPRRVSPLRQWRRLPSCSASPHESMAVPLGMTRVALDGPRTRRRGRQDARVSGRLDSAAANQASLRPLPRHAAPHKDALRHSLA